MTIGVFCDEIIKELGYDTVDKKLDRRNIIVRADAERAELMGVIAGGGAISAGQSHIRPTKGRVVNFPDIFYISRSTPVQFDTSRGKFFSNMPTDWLSFDGNNGIRVVRLAKDNVGSNYMVAQMAGAGVLFGSLESAQLGGQIGYEIEGTKLFYNNMPANQYNEVLVTYIPTLQALAETDILPCDATFAATLMAKTREAFMPQRQIPQDLANDGKSNP